MDRSHYWNQVYATRRAEKLGWYKPRLELSLAWIGDQPLVEIA